MNANVLATAKRVFRKARKQRGVEYPESASEYLVALVKGKSVEVFRELPDGSIEMGTKFVIGDLAEYDSYNLSYTGFIESITDKSVTIVKSYGKQVNKHRLDLYQFCWRNHKFNAAETARRNAEESMNI